MIKILMDKSKNLQCGLHQPKILLFAFFLIIANSFY